MHPIHAIFFAVIAMSIQSTKASPQGFANALCSYTDAGLDPMALPCRPASNSVPCTNLKNVYAGYGAPQSKSKRRLLRQSDAVLSTRDTPPRDQDLWCLAGTNTFVIPRLFAKAQVPDSAQVIAEGTNSTIAETIDQTQDHIDHYKDGVINYGYDSGWRVHGDNFVYLEVTHAKKNQVTYGVLNSAIKALRDYMSQPGKWFGQCGFDIWDGPNQVGEGYIRSYGF